MRSIFWRIFLTFWLTMTLIVVASVTVSFYIASQRLEAMEDVRPHEVAAVAAEVLRDGGVGGLRQWLKSNPHPAPGMHLLVFDTDGRELLDRPVPDDIRRSLRRARVREGMSHDHLPSNFRPPRRWPRIVGPGGEEFAVMMRPVRPGPLGIFSFGTTRLAVLGIALAVSALVCWLLARTLSSPVLKMQAATRALAGGALDTRVSPGLARRRDEIGVLARDFDTMAERLDRLIRSQRELLRNISHELRSPLARMAVALELARRRTTGAGEELDRIEREAGRLDKLVGQVIGLARLQEGATVAARQPVDLSEVVAQVVADARYEAGDEAVAYAAGPALTILGDRTLLRSAVENVVRNAVRYTAAGTAVEVALTPDPSTGDCVVTVRDHGPGVPTDALDDIFDPFFRVAEARDRDSGGEGIGLAVTAEVVRAHGGHVRANNAPGGGLVVEIRLPSGG